MSKVTLSGHIEVPLAELEKVREALTEHVALTRAEPGCMVFEITERTAEKGVFDVYEEFDSRAAFEHHQKRVRDSDWGKITTNVKREYTVDGLDH